MRSIKLLYLPLFLLFFHFQTSSAQQSKSLDEGSIEAQFQYLEKKSGNYRANGVRYEVIKLFELSKLKQNVFDSLQTANNTIADLKKTIAQNKSEINALNAKLEETTKNLNETRAEKDSMSFFGAQVSKGTYKLIMGVLLLTFILSLLFFIYKFRKSNFLTQQAKSALADLEEEYEQHRRRALEREQKISRQLQDELNKNKKTL
ncbi:tRNA (guanine-N1)-methyltransferase [Allomuricauda sp. SCSIO 65647]|uniref:tRNA (guanine-N1)-methyltransferase n=1 Tax=Allomuricauda sp. SCSIO 65647 TaxID=2908843 RepID=UPI001F4105B0|nr:tRNA (guanine-N1)-methyltransferase [Muricauda sp. SCSIO 65647]UJH67628.1 tRNA (guanine-N1)-methyltransferase [Muricauda sp. SCSIO 65647]